MRRFRERLAHLLEATRDAARQDIPAGALRDQVRPGNIPPASGGSRGGVTLSDDDPAEVVASAANPGASSSASRADHVHALTSTAVTPGSYGDATHVAAITVDQDGRLTAAAAVVITAGLGTVTSVALTMPAIFSVADSPITTSGTLAVTLATETANTVWAGPTSGGAATPTFRALVATDIPDISATYQPLDATLTALAAYNTNGLLTQTAADTFTGRTITGTSNRIGVTNGDGVAGNPTIDISSSYVGQATITTLGTIATGTWHGTVVGVLYGGTGADLSLTGGAGQFLKQTSVGGAVSVLTIQVTDIPGLPTSQITSGIFGLARGGTAADLSSTGGTAQYLKQSSLGAAITVGQIPYGDITYSSLTTGAVFRATGATSAQFGTLDLSNSSAVTNALAIGNGGTGQTTANAGYAALSPMTTRGDLITRSATVPIRLAVGSSATYLRSDGTDPSWQSITYTDLTYSGLTTGQALRATGATSAAFGAIDLANTSAVTGVLAAANGGTGINNSTRTLTISTNAGTLAFSAASKTLTIAQSVTLDGASGKTLTLTDSLTVSGNDGTLSFGSSGLTLTYDTGTYTPTYLGASTAGTTTYSLQAGFWTRLGNLITCWGAVVWTAATGTGTAIISLPFTATATANANFSGSVRVSSVTFANSTPEIAFGASATSWSMVSPLTNAGGTNVAVEAAGNIIWTITYAVD